MFLIPQKAGKIHFIDKGTKAQRDKVIPQVHTANKQ
jgi:hypothetical protein